MVYCAVTVRRDLPAADTKSKLQSDTDLLHSTVQVVVDSRQSVNMVKDAHTGPQSV